MRVQLTEQGATRTFALSIEGIPETMVSDLQTRVTNTVFDIHRPENPDTKAYMVLNRASMLELVRMMATPEFGRPGLGQIPCIKIIRQFTGMGLREAKEFTDEARKAYGLWGYAPSLEYVTHGPHSGVRQGGDR